MLPNASAVNANPRKISCKLEIGSDTITNVKMLTYSSDWSGNITVGQVVSSYISATLPTPSFSLAGVNVTLSMGIGNPVNWVQIGIFRVDEESIQTKQGYTSFNAYDKLYYSVNTYHSTGNKSLQTICNEVCSAIGITSATLSASITIDSSILDGYTLRDVLSFIAGYQGKNAYLSPSGALDLRWFTSSSYTADGTRANIPYIGENDCTIGRWICQTQDGVITSGSGEGIYFTCPFMTQTRLNALQSQSLTYRKADVDIPYGNFCLQSGDIITVSTTGSNLTVPIMSNSWTYDGGVASSVSSYGASDYTGTANNAERSLSVRRVQRQMAVYRAASDLKIASEKITGASGGYIRINFGGDGKTAALLIMDTEDISTAQNVWVFNQGGLGHFPNGYDPTAQANVALTYDGWVVAERISGTLISGVGIENVAPGTSTRPKIVLEQGEIKFQRVAAEPDGTISNIGSIKFNQRSAQEEIDSLSMRVQYGKTVTIGYENNGAVNDQFVYYSDLSAPNVPSDAAKFNFWGDLRIFSDLHWISLTDLDKRIEQQRLVLADIIDNSGQKNQYHYDGFVNGTPSSPITWTMNSDDSITVNGVDNSRNAYIYFTIGGSAANIDYFCDDNHYLSGCPEGGSGSTYRMYCAKGNYTRNDEGNGVLLDSTTETGILVVIMIYRGYSCNNLTFRPMICTKDAWNISRRPVPWAPSNRELYEMIQNL